MSAVPTPELARLAAPLAWQVVLDVETQGGATRQVVIATRGLPELANAEAKRWRSMGYKAIVRWTGDAS